MRLRAFQFLIFNSLFLISLGEPLHRKSTEINFGAFSVKRRAMPFGAASRSLHHLRGCATLAASVVPLLCASRKAEPFLSQKK